MISLDRRRLIFRRPIFRRALCLAFLMMTMIPTLNVNRQNLKNRRRMYRNQEF